MADEKPIAQREEWADVVPLPQDDGPAKICAIAYLPDFEESMNYFRAIVQRDERSERALWLTERVIDGNAANYTAWYYRAKCLEDLGKDPREELKFVEELAFDNAKNYQVWHHRRLMVERLGDAADGAAELQFTTEILDADDDSKNYHAWAHRQWVLKRFKLWEGELEYIEQLLAKDQRNNSAWNQRYFVVSNTSRREDGSFDRAVVEREIEFAFKYIARSPNNQSPWNYLRGFMKPLTAFPSIVERCEEMSKKYILCAHVFSLLVDVYESEGTAESLQKGIDTCGQLIERADIMRCKYWAYRKEQLEKKVAAL
eukprot:TRINITY_DN636_c0_g1_i2.p1 TRINITY_DN636_c0_g1~~TRINITY_DN636_c0_g1_i2.p1  ORF type:complete len:345 (+),score=99.78 TRINITY_DN636_c0_g1_i2:94-1035(+)